MPYYLRAFCTSQDRPPLRAVFEWAASQGVHLDAPSAYFVENCGGLTQADAEGFYERERLIVELD